MPAARCSSARRIRTARDDEPESIQTASVSLDLATAAAPFQSFGFRSDQSSPADFSNHTFAPCFSIKSAVLRMIAGSRIGSPFASWKAGSGTPQVRWREMHQSGRDCTALLMRLTPQSGIHCTRSISARARTRKVLECADLSALCVSRLVAGALGGADAVADFAGDESPAESGDKSPPSKSILINH